MQFSGREDIGVPIDAVFAMISEVERFERLAIRRGIEVQRKGNATPLAAGLAWETAYMVRGRLRRMDVVLTKAEPPTLLRFHATGKGVEGDTAIELVALSPRQTRLSVDLTITAKTLPARLLLQSLKLGRSRFRRRFQIKLAEFAKSLEARHNAGA